MAGGSAGGVNQQAQQQATPVVQGSFGAGVPDASNNLNGVPAGAPAMQMGANGVPVFGGVDPATQGPSVYTGRQVPVPSRYPGPPRFMAQATQPELVPISKFEDLPVEAYFKDRGSYNEMVDQLQASGLLGQSKKGRKPSLEQVTGAWKTLLIGASYNQQYSPAEYLQLAASSGLFKNVDGTQPQPEGAYKGPVASTNITNQFDAKSLVNNALQQYLGRTATEKELAQFHAQLNQTEMSNPTVRTPNGHDVTTTGGAGSGAQEAVDFAKSRNDYAETQAGATGLKWMQEAILNHQQNRMI